MSTVDTSFGGWRDPPEVRPAPGRVPVKRCPRWTPVSGGGGTPGGPEPLLERRPRGPPLEAGGGRGRAKRKKPCGPRPRTPRSWRRPSEARCCRCGRPWRLRDGRRRRRGCPHRRRQQRDGRHPLKLICHPGRSHSNRVPVRVWAEISFSELVLLVRFLLGSSGGLSAPAHLRTMRPPAPLV